jgi:hypothetical protein
MHRTLPGTVRSSFGLRLTVGLLVALPCLAVLAAPSHAQARPPTALDAKMCRMLAYENYPQERPGKAAGSGARYQFYRDCIAKRTGSEPLPQAPEKARQ